MNSSKAAFLGDANFPVSALEYYRDGRQMLLQDLYQRYSGLAFTVPSDRSIAILGLERRLARTFKTRALYGVFNVYLGRGLLWQRGSPQRMKHIAWKSSQGVPSWSWFSKQGPIKFMDLKFERIVWATKELKGPFSPQQKPVSTQAGSFEEQSAGEFVAPARNLVLTTLELLVKVSFDVEDEFNIRDLRCVEIGRDKTNDAEDRPRVHVLIVHPIASSRELVYKRVGAASLMLSNIGNQISRVRVR